MRIAGSWIAVLVATVALAGAGCGDSTRCSPECRAGFECYYGVCAPVGPSDGGGDVSVEADEAAPRDDGGPVETIETTDTTDVPVEVVGCTDPSECDDGNACTQDLCDELTGTCYNPGAVDGTACEDDGNACTADTCLGGYCAHEGIPDCCTRDADCMWPGHLWECDAAAGTCYDPPQAEFCGECMTRVNCGDGGDSSDDWCVIYSYTSRGCSKDCIDDVDCPGGGICWSSENRACDLGEAGCYCVSRLGSCAALRQFGAGCMVDEMCRGCDGCDSLFCSGGTCTWNCEIDQDCVWGAHCAEGVCVADG